MEQQNEEAGQNKQQNTEINWKQLLNSSKDLLELNSNETLICAIIFYPQLFSLLLEKCEYNKKNEILKSSMQNWALELDQLKISEFRKSESEKESQLQGASINKMCEIYVERCSQCWRWNTSPKLIDWLTNAIECILKLHQDNSFENLVIEGQYNSLPFGIERYKGLIKSRFSPEEAKIDFNNIEDNNIPINPQQYQQQQGQHFIDPNQGFLQNFFQSLLPWYQVPNAGDQQQQHQQQQDHDDQNEEMPDEEWQDWEDFN